MKKVFFIAIAVFTSIAVNAQYTQFKSQAEIKQEALEKAKQEAKAAKQAAIQAAKAEKEAAKAAKQAEKAAKQAEKVEKAQQARTAGTPARDAASSPSQGYQQYVKAPQKPAEKPKSEAKPKDQKEPEMKIDAKYAAGACPLVDGKVQWETTIKCPGLNASQIYDRVLAFLDPYCTEKGKDADSRIAIVNPSTHEIGARIGEYVEFSRSSFSLDRAMMHYTLCLYCFNGECKVVMKNISFKYEDSYESAESRLSDENALNKTKTDFKKGGYEKFRTKTIDAKDALFQRLADIVK